jgi:hypothetical protein
MEAVHAYHTNLSPNGEGSWTSHPCDSSLQRYRRYVSKLNHEEDHHMRDLQQVEEELATLLHLLLHGSASLECVSRADNQGQIMSP